MDGSESIGEGRLRFAHHRDRIKIVLAVRIVGRVGEATEIANTVLFVASDEASFVNGVELFVDGGQAKV